MNMKKTTYVFVALIGDPQSSLVTSSGMVVQGSGSSLPRNIMMQHQAMIGALKTHEIDHPLLESLPSD